MRIFTNITCFIINLCIVIEWRRRKNIHIWHVTCVRNEKCYINPSYAYESCYFCYPRHNIWDDTCLYYEYTFGCCDWYVCIFFVSFFFLFFEWLYLYFLCRCPQYVRVWNDYVSLCFCELKQIFVFFIPMSVYAIHQIPHKIDELMYDNFFFSCFDSIQFLVQLIDFFKALWCFLLVLSSNQKTLQWQNFEMGCFVFVRTNDKKQNKTI